MPYGRDTVNFINKKCKKLLSERILQAEELKNEFKYHGLKENLCRILAEFGLVVKIHFYGSRVIGLANKESDLDIFIEHENNFYSNKDVERDRRLLEKIAVAIENGGLWKMKHKTLSASVPILQVIYLPEMIKCDISVSNGIGVKNTLITKYLFDLQPKVKEFYIFMKIFLDRYEDYDFDGYLLKLLVIFFFQVEKVLPSIILVQEEVEQSTINGWNVEFNASRPLSHYGINQLSVYKVYVPKFFTFYADINFIKYAISTHDGALIERRIYPYRDEIEDKLLCVFGPINRKHNIGKYPSEGSVKYFVKLCDSLASEFNKKYVFTE